MAAFRKAPDRDVQASTDLDWQQLDVPGGSVGFATPIHVEATVRNLGNHLLAAVVGTTVVRMHCDRCLDAYESPLRVVYTEPFQTQAQAMREPLDLGDDIERHGVDEETQRIDLDPSLRENLILALPTQRLCREDCLGLCPRCGANLNVGPCGCDAQAVAGRWSRLRELFDGEDQDETDDKQRGD